MASWPRRKTNQASIHDFHVPTIMLRFSFSVDLFQQTIDSSVDAIAAGSGLIDPPANGDLGILIVHMDRINATACRCSPYFWRLTWSSCCPTPTLALAREPLP